MKKDIFITVQLEWTEKLTTEQSVDLKAAIDNLIEIAERNNVSIQVNKN